MERRRGTGKQEEYAASAAPARGRVCPVLQLPFHCEKGKGVWGIFEGDSEMGFRAGSSAVICPALLSKHGNSPDLSKNTMGLKHNLMIPKSFTTLLFKCFFYMHLSSIKAVSWFPENALEYGGN